MRGSAGFTHYGHPCFVRDDYEAAHSGETELQRLEDALDIFFSDTDTAMQYAFAHARYLLYRCESDDVDSELLRGRDKWMSFRDGYVHIVTGEFVRGRKPSRDSYPCWRLDEPSGSYFDPNSSVQLSGKLGLLAMAFGFLATVMGGKR